MATTTSTPIIRAPLHTLPITNRGKIAIQSLPLHASTLTRVTIQPGGSWSSDLKPHVGTNSCEKTHAGIVLKGTLVVRMDDGTEERFREGDAFGVKPGHDAWCPEDGEGECVFVEWSSG